LRERVVSGDRNTGGARSKQSRGPGDAPRDKPVEAAADEGVGHGGT
jgi:hypothetical protein